jgi:hypothetical protein
VRDLWTLHGIQSNCTAAIYRTTFGFELRVEHGGELIESRRPGAVKDVAGGKMAGCCDTTGKVIRNQQVRGSSPRVGSTLP